jgi:hypothetical protein
VFASCDAHEISRRPIDARSSPARADPEQTPEARAAALRRQIEAANHAYYVPCSPPGCTGSPLNAMAVF